MNRLEAERVFEVKLKNKLMKENSLDIKYYVNKNSFGDYHLKTQDNTGSLAERLELLRKAKKVIENNKEIFKFNYKGTL